MSDAHPSSEQETHPYEGPPAWGPGPSNASLARLAAIVLAIVVGLAVLARLAPRLFRNDDVAFRWSPTMICRLDGSAPWPARELRDGSVRCFAMDADYFGISQRPGGRGAAATIGPARRWSPFEPQ